MKPVQSNIGTENSDQVSSGAKKPKSRALIYAIIVVTLFAALFLWKQIEISNIRKEAKQERTRLEDEAKQQMFTAHEQHLQLFAVPFVWALRTEMLQGNLSQVHLYVNQMVKEKNFKSIVIADEKGVIVSSTNKKFEGQPFTNVGKEAYLSTNQTIIERVNDVLTCASPIMGFNNKLGTLLLTYQIPKIQL